MGRTAAELFAEKNFCIIISQLWIFTSNLLVYNFLSTLDYIIIIFLDMLWIFFFSCHMTFWCIDFCFTYKWEHKFFILFFKFCSTVFYFILFYSIPFHSILFYFDKFFIFLYWRCLFLVIFFEHFILFQFHRVTPRCSTILKKLLSCHPIHFLKFPWN